MKAGVNYIGVGCGALIINEKKEILLLKRSQNSRNEKGFWSIPGGKVDFSELLENAIKRETYEEIGVEIEIIKNLGTIDHIIPLDKQHWISIAFLSKIKEGEPKICEPNKFEDLKWFNIENLPKNLAISFQETLKLYKNQ